MKDVIGNILQDEKIPGRPYRVWESVRGAHGRGLVFIDAYRRGRPQFRYLGGRRQIMQSTAVSSFEAMIPELRARSMRRLHTRKVSALPRTRGCSDTGTHVRFRHSETPCIRFGALPRWTAWRGTAKTDPQLVEQSRVPEAYPMRRCPHATTFPTRQPSVVHAGGFRRGPGRARLQHPKLVEIQGFPSLYGYQPGLSQAHLDTHGLTADAALPSGGLTTRGTTVPTRRSWAGTTPDEVVADGGGPAQQKTLCDFLVTARHSASGLCASREIRKHGNKLYYGRTDRRSRSGASTIGRSSMNWSAEGRRSPTFRLARRPGCRVGRPSQLVFPVSASSRSRS